MKNMAVLTFSSKYRKIYFQIITNRKELTLSSMDFERRNPSPIRTYASRSRSVRYQPHPLSNVKGNLSLGTKCRVKGVS